MNRGSTAGLVLAAAVLLLASVAYSDNGGQGSKSSQRGLASAEEDMFGRDWSWEEVSAVKKIKRLETNLDQIKKRESSATPVQRAKDAKRVAAINREVENLAGKHSKSPVVQSAAGELKMGQGDFKSASKFAVRRGIF